MADGTTTTYGLTKPEVGSSEDTWGEKINGVFDDLDDLLDGTTPVTGIDINSGTIDGVTIGGSSAPTVTDIDINGGTIDGVTIGGASAGAITGTTVTATGLVTAQDGLVVDNDGATVATFDRATSDGTIAEFQKDGSTVGSIGVNGDKVYLATPSASVGFDDSSKVFYPGNSSGANSDNTHDIGASTVRFKDLYLSGGVYLGGTGSANKLDDYEEGTWTPVYEGSSSNPTVTYGDREATYTKIGNLVRVDFAVQTTNISSAGSGTFRVAGLPFTTSGTTQRSAGSLAYNDTIVQTSAGITPTVNQNQNFIRFNFFQQDSATMNSGIDCSDLSTGASIRYIQASIIYRI